MFNGSWSNWILQESSFCVQCCSISERKAMRTAQTNRIFTILTFEFIFELGALTKEREDSPLDPDHSQIFFKTQQQLHFFWLNLTAIDPRFHQWVHKGSFFYLNSRHFRIHQESSTNYNWSTDHISYNTYDLCHLSAEEQTAW